MIGIYERRILRLVSWYWKKNPAYIKIMPKKKRIKWSEEDVRNHHGDNGFNSDELYRLSILSCTTKICNYLNNSDRKEKIYQRALLRLYADGYLEDRENQLFITDRGILAATDRLWIITIIRENREWLLSLIIAVLAFIVSIISLLFSIC